MRRLEGKSQLKIKQDVLIALTSIKNCLILVTEDKNLKRVTEEFNGQAITFEQFQKGEYKEFKDTEIGRIPKHWKVVKIGDIAQTSSGGTPSRAKREYYGGNIPWVKSSERTDNIIYDTEEKITKEGLQNSSAKIFPKGTLLIAMYGATVGKTAILGIDAATNQAICAILPNKTFDPNFLKSYIIFKRDRLISISSGGAQPNISQEIIRAFKIPLPPLSEQQRITEVFLTLDKKLEIERNEKVKLERIKQGLMDLLLTGKIRVKVN
jgi:type I restriction enzyme S subunit